MPHPTNRKALTRQRILEAAARLFAAHGFEATSIEAVMSDCGLTRGGFYAHFRSKAHLYQEAVHAIDPITSAGLASSAEWLDNLFAACRGIGASEWAFLARDVANASPEVRDRYLKAVKTIRDNLAYAGPPSTAFTQDQALAAAAMLIGTLAVSSTVNDPAFKVALITACRSAIRKMGEEEQPVFFWAVDAALSNPLHRATQPSKH